MTHSRAWLSTAAIIGLVFGLNFPDPNLSGGRAPLLPLGFTLLAANETQDNDQSKLQSDENADESAKMGKESGTHSGDQGSPPENDTKKVDQPPRENPIPSD
jgi:hypothetical protein